MQNTLAKATSEEDTKNIKALIQQTSSFEAVNNAAESALTDALAVEMKKALSKSARSLQPGAGPADEVGMFWSGSILFSW